jgi:glycosyltransferase involved in cell wall biosynthesis
VIATKEGAIPEIIDDGITGFIVDKNRPDEIADKVEIFYYNRYLLNQMGLAGREKYEQKYKLEIFENNIKNVFNEVIEEN